MKAWFVFLFGLVATPAFAQQVAAALPAVPDPSGTYLVYLHGRIVEDLGPRPTDPRFGLYDYPAILEALASSGATVISSQLPPATNDNEYAGIVEAQVESRIHRNGTASARERVWQDW